MSNNNRFNGQVVFIAGGAGTVGSGIASAFLNEGAYVAIPSRSESSIQKLKSYVKGQEDRILILHEDISTIEGATKVKEAVIARFGKIDHCISSLGSWIAKGPMTTVSLADFRDAIQSLCESHFIVAKVFLPLIANKEGSTYTIITGGAGERSYGAESGLTTLGSAALYGLNIALRAEYANSAVRLNEFRINIKIERDEDLKLPYQHSHLKVGQAVVGVAHSNKRNEVLISRSADDLTSFIQL